MGASSEKRDEGDLHLHQLPDHATGAVNALLAPLPAGKLDDHPGARRTLLDAFWPALPNQATRDVLAAQKTVDDFFQHKLDADWLKARLAVEDMDKDSDGAISEQEYIGDIYKVRLLTFVKS